MTLRLKVDQPETTDQLSGVVQGVLGQPLNRVEGPLKVCGAAPYSAEDLPEGVVYGVLVQAPITAGEITTVGDARGVLAVIHDPRMIRYGGQGASTDAPPGGPDQVAYMGQAVALVVAGTFEVARSAAQNLALTCSPERVPVNPGAVEPELPRAGQSASGDLDKAMAEAAFRLDQTYTTPSQMSAAMEPQAALAEWDGTQMTLRTSIQILATSKQQLAKALKLKPDNLRLLAPYVGGGFVSRLGINAEAVAAGIAAQQLHRPVLVVMSRTQVFELSNRRPETTQRIRLAADSTGRLTGIGHEARVSGLPGSDYSEPVTQATPFTYQAENRQIIHKIARVHRGPAGSVRAPGEAVGVAVFDCAMDELAEQIGICPVAFRLRNIPETEPVTGRPYSSNKLAEALRVGAEKFGWSERAAKPRQRLDGEWYIGLGMASAVRVNRLVDSRARVVLSPRGAAQVETDMTDIGTGSYTILAQIAAETLGLPPDQVSVTLGDTDLPASAGSGGSFGAASSGNSVYLACLDIRQQLADLAGIPAEALPLQDGMLRSGSSARPLSAVMSAPLTGEGHLQPGKTEKSVRQATWGSHWAEVAVNRWTGEIRVRRMLGVFACGRILNEKTARSQCLGGIVFGLGGALTEALEHDPRTGHAVSRDLAEYHLPCHADIPQIEVHLLPERDASAGPLQAKGLGELGGAASPARCSMPSTMPAACASAICPRRRTKSSGIWTDRGVS